ncbi:MAG TPA: bifunctional 4-hydroxy-2-oxoglutarate aldolase/2-dehydro-3-deoxy-phosphogluconate aldolase [Polyangiaceae bacterium]|nr:bifunctional 4-hydroxy-2-oxoglutarate aldolase/2-dehydro-3-deoxy-phosphogluconate aldolase [Polyangiaceae bacterium]
MSTKLAAPALHPIEVCRQHKLVPVIAIKDADSAADLAAALASGGLPVVEITMRTEAAPAAMSKIAAAKTKVTLLAGTVTTPDQVKLAVDSGAEMIISPGLNTRVIEHCLKHDIPVLPGVCTPTEIETARNYGLKYLKFFPAEAYGGVKTLKALGDVYSAFGFMPTGGINAQNLGDYLKLPIVVACGGSWMAPADLINQRKFDDITALAAQAVTAVKALTQ